MRCLQYLYKFVSKKQPTYLHDLNPSIRRSLQNKVYIYESYYRTVSFENSFLPYAIKEWNKLDPENKIVETYASFQKMLLNFVIPTRNSSYKLYDLPGIKPLTMLRLGFRYLLERKFRHNFVDPLNLLCSWYLKTESALHFFRLSKLYYFT